ncbi:hypothetical protein NC651_026015 [Populus alba x Populus x berolinensis]|nr:hypothetical protein NC651_026015 [Populus alba x Populus x berolinensis]
MHVRNTCYVKLRNFQANGSSSNPTASNFQRGGSPQEDRTKLREDQMGENTAAREKQLKDCSHK